MNWQQRMIEDLENKYNPDRDLIQDAPEVTASDCKLLALIKNLCERIGTLESMIQSSSESLEPAMLTVKDIEDRVEEIKVSDDNEDMHGAEDALWEEVLHAIAQDATNAAALAQAALRTTELEFTRWCA